METILSTREGDHFDLVKDHNILVPINILERERERERERGVKIYIFY